MYLSSTRYIAMLILQLSLMLVDLAINAFAIFFRKENIVLLVVYIIQDFCLVFSLISIFLNFFSTFIFQAGLIGLLLERFKTAIFFCILYLILTITYHVWSLTLQWHFMHKPTWTTSLLALFIFQRLTAAIYYYCYKRTILKLSDPRYYEDFRWLQ
ncbi:hypothetical protein J437_LFUL004389 [Ladona fulva]|uniref:Transmembrane protein 138 n=1 Tax=Ladona fulva TaxID=123851 RepID=A0A8K0K678_LADFU|nr:hypothetical protein J437_LFUL004389 [Ladona fulva]